MEIDGITYIIEKTFEVKAPYWTHSVWLRRPRGKKIYSIDVKMVDGQIIRKSEVI